MTLLEQVICRLRRESPDSRQFEHLKPFLMVGGSDPPYRDVAAGLGITEGAARVAVHRLRRRYRELLREEIAQTLADPAQADDELRALFVAFAK